MHISSTLVLAAAALFQLAAAIPPACLLGALNSGQQNLADVKTICSQKAADVQSSIASMCGSSTNAALSSFADTCQAEGVNVPKYTSPSSRPSGTASQKGTSTTNPPAKLTPSATNATTPAAATSSGAAVKNVAGGILAIAAGLAVVI